MLVARTNIGIALRTFVAGICAQPRLSRQFPPRFDHRPSFIAPLGIESHL